VPVGWVSPSSRGLRGGAALLLYTSAGDRNVRESRHLEKQRATAATRLDLEVCAGWARPSSRGLWGGDALLLSTGAAGNRNPDPKMVRREQVGAFYPFFRGHAHQETKRREPWLFGEPHTGHIRDALRLRYNLLPYIYTQVSG
jgi:hypothetical protein